MRTLQRQNRPQALAEIAGSGLLGGGTVGCRVCESSMSRLIPQMQEKRQTPLWRFPQLMPRLGGEGRVGDKMFLLRLILAEAEPGSDSPPAAHSAATLNDS